MHSIRKILLIICILGGTVFSYMVFRAFYPADDFYVREFNDNAGLKLPNSVSIKAKTATYPDIHGSYTACAVLKLSENEFIKLRDQVAAKQDPKLAALAEFLLMDSERFFRNAGVPLQESRRVG